MLFFNICSCGSALFLNVSAMVQDVEEAISWCESRLLVFLFVVGVWFYFSVFFFWITSLGTFGTKPTLLWIINKLLLSSLGVQLTFQFQHSFLCSKGGWSCFLWPFWGTLAARTGLSSWEGGQSLALLWLKSWYCDTSRCSQDWLSQFIKYSYN